MVIRGREQRVTFRPRIKLRRDEGGKNGLGGMKWRVFGDYISNDIVHNISGPWK